MFDQRSNITIDLSEAEVLKDNAVYKFADKATGKPLIAKLIADYTDENDSMLLSEARKLILLSAEPEIGTVYYLATAILNGKKRNCYVMNFIQGKSIGQLVKENTTLSADQIVDIISQLALGLEKAHHYEVYHHDLHEENIIIDDWGYVKIIDFMFYDIGKSQEEKTVRDIEQFNKIIDLLFSNCTQELHKTIEPIIELCAEVTTFKNLSKNIGILYQILGDYSLLPDYCIPIISRIIHELPDFFTLDKCLAEQKIEVPSLDIFSTTEEEEKLLENNNKKAHFKLELLDTRIDRIRDHYEIHFEKRLHPLISAGLINFDLWVLSEGDSFVGPYNINYQIRLTPKLKEWKKVSSLFPFILPQNSEESLLSLIMEGAFDKA